MLNEVLPVYVVLIGLSFGAAYGAFSWSRRLRHERVMPAAGHRRPDFG